MPGEVNATLLQQGKLGYTREFQLYNGRELRINLGAGSKQNIYQVHLLALADKSKSRFHIAWPWFGCFIASLAGLVVYWIVNLFTSIDANIGFAIILACILGIILGLVMLILKFYRKRVFYSRYANIPIFEMLINKPDSRSYKNFLDILDSYTLKARSFYALRVDQQIAGEMRMLRRLAKEKIISQSVYDAAKDKLFNISDNKSR